MLFLAGGCGPRIPHGDQSWANATVRIRLADTALTEGEVVLIATEGSGGVDAGGSLDAQGTAVFPVLPGAYTVVVRPLPPSQDDMDRPRPSRQAPVPRSTIPVKFQAAKTSPLKIDVRETTKPEFTFDLDSAPSP